MSGLNKTRRFCDLSRSTIGVYLYAASLVYRTPKCKDVSEGLKRLSTVGMILPVFFASTTNEELTVVHRVGKVAGLAEVEPQ